MKKKHQFWEGKGNFKLIDCHLSHNEILFRSFSNNDRDYNIDILFKGTLSINIATSFTDVKIFAVSKTLDQTAKTSLDLEKYIFLLEDHNGVQFFIEAAAFGVFENNLGFHESSLGDFMWSDENKCIFWSHDDNKFKSIFGL